MTTLNLKNGTCEHNGETLYWDGIHWVSKEDFMVQAIKDELDQMDKELHELEAQYDKKFDDVNVNEFGETSASEVLEINKWYKDITDQCRNEHIKNIIKMQQ